MIKVNIYFRVINNETTQILDRLREERLPYAKIWLPKDGQDYIIRFRTRDIAIIDYNKVYNLPECYRWDIESKIVYPEIEGLDHLLARTIDYNTGFVCVDSRRHPCGQIVLFHDSIQHSDYPDRFYRIPVFDSYLGLRSYIEAIPDHFSLENNPRFSRTVYIEQGARVYVELATNRYWYLDNLHKDHYEVFSPQGIHIGEANLNGELDYTKRDIEKRVKF